MHSHFHNHDFNNFTLKIINFKKNINERLLSESQYIRSSNTIYSYGSNFQLYNNAKLSNYDNYKNIYPNLNRTIIKTSMTRPS